MKNTAVTFNEILKTLDSFWLTLLKIFSNYIYLYYSFTVIGCLFILYWGIKAIRSEHAKEIKFRIYNWVLSALLVWLGICFFILTQMAFRG